MARDLQAEMMREQALFEKAQSDAIEMRLVKVALDNPDVCIDMLAERFGRDKSWVSRILGIHRIRRPRPEEHIKAGRKVGRLRSHG